MTAETLSRVEGHLLELLQASAKHEQTLASVDYRLGVLNGTVARHEDRLLTVQQFAAAHPVSCEVAAKVDGLVFAVERNRMERQADISGVRKDLIEERAKDLAAIVEVKAELTAERASESATQKERARWNARLHPAYLLCIVLFVLLVIRNVDLVPQAFRMVFK